MGNQFDLSAVKNYALMYSVHLQMVPQALWFNGTFSYMHVLDTHTYVFDKGAVKPKRLRYIKIIDTIKRKRLAKHHEEIILSKL